VLVSDPADEAGTTDANGTFVEVSKTRARVETVLRVSIDPWHSEEHVDDGGGLPAYGFDLFFTAAHHNLPAMIRSPCSTALLTTRRPQIAYIEKRGYPIVTSKWARTDQHAMPEDYPLYRWAPPF